MAAALKTVQKLSERLLGAVLSPSCVGQSQHAGTIKFLLLLHKKKEGRKERMKERK